MLSFLRVHRGSWSSKFNRVSSPFSDRLWDTATKPIAFAEAMGDCIHSFYRYTEKTTGHTRIAVIFGRSGSVLQTGTILNVTSTEVSTPMDSNILLNAFVSCDVRTSPCWRAQFRSWMLGYHGNSEAMSNSLNRLKTFEPTLLVARLFSCNAPQWCCRGSS